jgi:hypothetical protein
MARIALADHPAGRDVEGGGGYTLMLLPALLRRGPL